MFTMNCDYWEITADNWDNYMEWLDYEADLLEGDPWAE